MDIPNSLYMHAIQTAMEDMFGYVPGANMDMPVLSLVDESEERKRLINTGDDQIFDIFKGSKL
jgi:formate dehydrogenase subunit beta